MSRVCAGACSNADGVACVAACVAEFTPIVIVPSEVGTACGLLVLSGLFSGLTLGLMSLDIRQLELVISGGELKERRQAERILPLRKRGNLLLCTLLLGNTLVNSAIAILTASFTGGIIGGVASTALILIFGEIIPQSVCSRYGMMIGAKLVDVLGLIILILFPVAWPLSKLLDRALGEELGTIYSRHELKQLFSMQAKRAHAENISASGQRGGGGAEGGGDGGGDAEMAEIGIQEATYVSGILSLSERTAEMIMTKLEDVFALFTDERLDFPNMSRIYASGYTRVPVFRRQQSAPPNKAERLSERQSNNSNNSNGGGGAAAPGSAAPGSALPPAGGQESEKSTDTADAARALAASLAASIRAAPLVVPVAGAPVPETLSLHRPSPTTLAVELQAGLDSGGSGPDGGLPPLPPPLSSSNASDAGNDWRGHEVAGLLSAKDLILVDPEDALSVDQLVASCGREVMMVKHDTPVNALFKEFTRGHSHLAFVQRRTLRPGRGQPAAADEASGTNKSNDNDKHGADGGASSSEAAAASVASLSGDDYYEELVGIVTLEDVLEELIQAEIVDESDVYTDNVSKRVVAEDAAAHQRRVAFNRMLDPKEVSLVCVYVTRRAFRARFAGRLPWRPHRFLEADCHLPHPLTPSPPLSPPPSDLVSSRILNWMITRSRPSPLSSPPTSKPSRRSTSRARRCRCCFANRRCRSHMATQMSPLPTQRARRRSGAPWCCRVGCMSCAAPSCLRATAGRGRCLALPAFERAITWPTSPHA